MRALTLIVVLAASLFAAAPVRAQSVPPDSLAAARELVVAMRLTDQVKTIFPMLMKSLKPVVTQNRPEVEKDFDAIMPVMIDSALARTNELVDLMAAVYARNFTVQELRDITSFYRTPTGQKLLEKMPTVMPEAMTAGQQFARSIVGDMQQRMIEELRKRGHNI